MALAVCLAVLLSGASCAAAADGWQDDTRLTEDPGISFPPPNNGKWITVDLEGRVHVVWADDRDRNFEIYHAYRTGEAWSVPARLTFSQADSKRPVLAVDSLGRVHLVYNDAREGNREIYHAIWSNGSWGPETRVSFTAGDSYASCISAEGLKIHLVYQEQVDGYLQVIYRYFDVFTWSVAEQVSFVESGMSMVPTVAAEPGGRIHVAWWDTREDSGGVAPGKIAYRMKDSAWSEEVIISGPEADAMRPNICVDDTGTAHVAWIDKRESNEQIYYARMDNGVWGEEDRLTSGDFTHYHPSLALSAGRLHLVFWANHPSNALAGVFYMNSDYSSWSGPLRISSENSTASLCNLTALPSGELHVVWQDLRDGNEEIYYNTFITSCTSTGDTDGPSDPGTVASMLSIGVYPNPSAGDATIYFGIPGESDVEICIYDSGGRLVRRISGGSMGGGTHSFLWDGRNGRGVPVTQGIYFVRGRAGKMMTAAKILLLR